MSTIVDLTTYMSGLASKHRLLHHQPKEKHFFRGEVQEFFMALRSEVNFPAMILEGCDVEFDGIADNSHKKRLGAFIIVDKYDQQDDYDTITERMGVCEEIGCDIVGRMLWDCDNGGDGCPIVSMDLEGIDGNYLQNEGQRYVGFRVSFEFGEQACLKNPNNWINEED